LSCGERKSYIAGLIVATAVATENPKPADWNLQTRDFRSPQDKLCVINCASQDRLCDNNCVSQDRSASTIIGERKSYIAGLIVATAVATENPKPADWNLQTREAH
jgi:hypothetical protein